MDNLTAVQLVVPNFGVTCGSMEQPVQGQAASIGTCGNANFANSLSLSLGDWRPWQWSSRHATACERTVLL